MVRDAGACSGRFTRHIAARRLDVAALVDDRQQIGERQDRHPLRRVAPMRHDRQLVPCVWERSCTASMASLTGHGPTRYHWCRNGSRTGSLPPMTGAAWAAPVLDRSGASNLTGACKMAVAFNGLQVLHATKYVTRSCADAASEPRCTGRTVRQQAPLKFPGVVSGLLLGFLRRRDHLQLPACRVQVVERSSTTRA